MTRDEESEPGLVRPGEGLDAAAALAAAVAHDLGNMLTAVLGNAELLGEALEDRPDLAEMVRLILAAAQAGTRLTGRLDQFARRIATPPEPTDGAAVVAMLAAGLAARLPADIRLETDVAPGLPPVPVAPSALALALQELVANAVAALRGRGVIRILAGRAGEGAATRIRFTVEDDGPGMPPELLLRLSRLRFTAGIASHRAGLGLALAARVALAGGGELRLDSAPAKGTRAWLDLPPADHCVAQLPLTNP